MRLLKSLATIHNMNKTHIFKNATFNFNGIDLFDCYDDIGTFLGKIISCEEEAVYDAIKAYPSAVRAVHRGTAYPIYSADERILISMIRDRQCLMQQVNYATRSV